MVTEQSYWMDKFSGSLQPAVFPPDIYLKRKEDKQVHSFEITGSIYQKLIKLSGNSDYNLHVTLLTGIFVLLSKYTLKDDLTIATPGYLSEDKPPAYPLLIRNNISIESSLKELILRIRQSIIEANNNSNYSTELLLKSLSNNDNGRDFSFLHEAAMLLENIQSKALPDTIVCNILFSFKKCDDRLTCDVHYNTALYSPDLIFRICEHTTSVLDSIISSPDCTIRGVSILKENQVNSILKFAKGEHIENGDKKTYLERFETLAETIPDCIAVISGERSITYGELNDRANQLAYVLLKKGITVNSVVGLLLSTSVDYVISLWGILKAGGSFLSIDIMYPLERKRYMIENASVQAIISDQRLINENIEILYGVDFDNIINIDKNDIWQSPTEKINIRRKLTDIDYILYTSGSSGKPKGVKIQGKGINNYLMWAMSKYVDDTMTGMGLFTSVSFDLTITSIFLPLISGKSLYLFNADEPEELLRSVIQNKKVNVIKITPSHLKILQLLGADIKHIAKFIVGGEQLTVDLALAIQTLGNTELKIFNEYGPTECTVGCMLYEFNSSEIFKSSNVLIGRPSSNCEIYILDQQGKVVPFGVPGEIYIGGVQVFEGYISNDSETKSRLVPSVFEDGAFLYKTGDMAMMYDDGNVVFLGRNDEQVKIRGYRIELNEIETELKKNKSIQDVIVIAVGNNDNKYLVAYYLSDSELNPVDIKTFLSEKLPYYMIPEHYVKLDKFPLTHNGKVDKNALPDPVRITSEYSLGPTNPKEEMLMRVWSEVLGFDKIGITDNFFSRGGDSIKSVQIAAIVHREGYKLSIKDIFNYPTIAKLATKIKSIKETTSQEEIAGEVRLTPIQNWFFDEVAIDRNHYNQSVLLNFPKGLTRQLLNDIFEKIFQHHDMLRSVFKITNDNLVLQEVQSSTFMSIEIDEVDLRNAENTEEEILTHANAMQSSFDLGDGPLVKFGLYHCNDGSRLHIVIHHLVIDGVSWRILFEDIDILYHQIKKSETPDLPLKSDSYKLWSEKLHKYAKSDSLKQAVSFWESVITRDTGYIPKDNEKGSNTIAYRAEESFRLSKEETDKLLKDSLTPFNVQINDVLLTALYISMKEYFGSDALKVDIESHGRDTPIENININRTIGWFTTIYPVILDSHATKLSTIIKEVKETLRALPDNGFSFLISKYLGNYKFKDPFKAQICFNYLGQFDSDIAGKVYNISFSPKGEELSQKLKRSYDLEIRGIVIEEQLEISLTYSNDQYNKSSIDQLLISYKSNLLEIIEYCCGYPKQELTPSDVTDKNISIEDLDFLQAHYQIEDVYPLSSMQEGMLFHALQDPQSNGYFEQVICQLTGRLEIDLVEKSVNDIVTRHDILRSAFVYNGLERPLQVVLKERNVEFSYKDVRLECLSSSAEEVKRRYRKKDKARKFDLSNDMLMRVTVLQLSESAYELIWSHHHILLDGWCMGIIVNEFNTIYSSYAEGSKPTLAASQPYAKYIDWLQKTDKVAAEEYWRAYTNSYDTLATLPQNTTTIGSGFDLKIKKFNVNKQQTVLLQKISTNSGTTLNTIIQTAWAILLSKYNNTYDVVFGSVVSCRPPEIEGIENMVGLFINTIPVRVKYDSGDDVLRLLKNTQKNTLASEGYQHYPLSKIHASSELDRNLFNHIIVFENFPIHTTINNEQYEKYFTIDDVELLDQTNYDFCIIVVPGEEIHFRIEYNSHVYNRVIINQLIDHFQGILYEMSDLNLKVSQLDILTERDKATILTEFNHSIDENSTSESLISIFEEQAYQRPNSVAVSYEGKSISYIEVNDLANKIARYLIAEKGLQPGDLVGVMFERDLYLIPVLFGIMKAGCIYMPIDCKYPADKINKILDNSGAQVLITLGKYFIHKVDYPERIVDLEKVMDTIMAIDAKKIDVAIDERAIAYVIYTSGSTGIPKGVVVEHKSLLNVLRFLQNKYPLNPGDVYLFKTNHSFDVSVAEIFGWFFDGGSLVILPPGQEMEPQSIVQTIWENRVSHINFVPSMFSVFLEELGQQNLSLLDSVKYFFLAGEALPAELAERYHETGIDAELENLYGPTECTIYSTSFSTRSFKGSNVPIGKPIDNVRAYILDHNDKMVPIGAIGELYIAGLGVARGYLNNSDLTDAKFIKSLPGHNETQRIYKTGDLARWLIDGNIEYLGRVDDQVKLRGFRIELGEIAYHLSKHSEIRDCVILDYGEGNAKYLVAYYVSDITFPDEKLRGYLLERLPEYMVPNMYCRMNSLPVTSNGKLDKSALPIVKAQTPSGYYQTATTLEEKVLQEVWSQVLGVDSPSITDNFFYLGGDSIKSIKISSRIRGLGYDLPVRYIMTYPTIAELSRQLKPLNKFINQSMVRGIVPFTPIQKWFFEGGIIEKHHYNQSVLMQFNETLNVSELHAIFTEIYKHHDALRTVFRPDADGMIQQVVLGTDAKILLEEIDLTADKSPEQLFMSMNQALQGDIDLSNGPLLKVQLYQLGDISRLIIIIHHLVVDGVSWRILFEDFETLYHQLKNDEDFKLPLKTNSFQSWSYELKKYQQSNTFREACKFWERQSDKITYEVPKDKPEGRNTYELIEHVSFQLSVGDTQELLTSANISFNTKVNDLLLVALKLSLSDCYNLPVIKVDMEGHGRLHPFESIDISRTVGWFTTIYPIILECSNEDNLAANIKLVKENLRVIPNQGLDYLMCHRDKQADIAQILFNYLGQFDEDVTDKVFELVDEGRSNEVHVKSPREYELVFSGIILNGRLEMRLMYSKDQYSHVTIRKLMNRYQHRLIEVIEYCTNYNKIELTPSDLSFRGFTITELDELQQRYEVEDVYYLSPMQEGMLFHAIYDSESAEYFEQITCKLRGKLDIAVVKQAMQELTHRHKVLRTAFLYEGYDRPLQCVLKSRSLEVMYKDLRKEKLDNVILLEQYCLEDRLKKFDLAKDSLMRLAILHVADDCYEFVWSYHHILMDGWCMGVIVNEFKDIYANKLLSEEVKLPLTQPYSRYINWIEAQNKQPSLEYWKDYLDGYKHQATLPKQIVSEKGYNPARFKLTIDIEQTAQLIEYSSQHSITINTLMQGAWAIILSKYNNSSDVVFGSVVSGRPAEIAGIETMIGLFINTLPVRISYDQTETIEQFLKEVQDDALESNLHQYYPLSEIQSLSELGNELFDHVIIFENFPLDEQLESIDHDGYEYLNFEDVKGRVQTNYGLNVKILPLQETEVIFEYNACIYSHEFISDLAVQFKNIISFIVENPGKRLKDISLYSVDELNRLSATYSENLDVNINVTLVQDMLNMSFSRHVHKKAIEYSGVEYSYSELERDVNSCVATLLNKRGETGYKIGVLCDDRYWCIVSMVAIMKARMIFVPLDTSLPKLRLESMIRQTRCDMIIKTDHAFEGISVDRLNSKLTLIDIEMIKNAEFKPGNLYMNYSVEDDIYIYFTSGSTGIPKGVIGKNKGLSHFIHWEISEFGIDKKDRFGHFTNPGFDVFLRDILVPLCSGATICIPNENILFTDSELTSWININDITFMHCVPSLFKIFNTISLNNNTFPSLRHILLAGEKIVPFELKNWYERIGDAIQLVNIYGPTETTLAKGYYRIKPQDHMRRFIPLMPLPGAQFMVLDKELSVCPKGAIGEVFIRTPYRSGGYINMPDENRRAFVQNPFNNKNNNDLIYKTGDVGRIHNNGQLEILGRIDHQVKIRGIRVELDDIKFNLKDVQGINEAAIILKETKDNNKALVAYYTADTEIDPKSIKYKLAQVLPSYMVPPHLIQIEAFPLTPNGKLDREKLPSPQKQINTIVPINQIEEVLIRLWMEILHIDSEEIGEAQSFFELGGHSIKAFYLMSRIKREFGVSLKMKEVFNHSTLRAMAALINSYRKTEYAEIPKAAEKNHYSLSPSQERMFYQHLLHEESAAYNISLPVRMQNGVDAYQIRSIFNELIKRHESLRTGFKYTEDGVVQVIYNDVDCEIIDVQGGSVQEAFKAFINPFDLFGKSLVRVGIFDWADDKYLFIDLHHIVADGFSLNILVKDFIKLYNGIPLAPLRISYKDYINWLKLPDAHLQSQSNYWVQRLSGVIGKLNLPVLANAENASNALGSGKVIFRIEKEDVRKLKKAAAENSVTEYMLLLSFFYLLISKISGASDIIVGTDVHGRTRCDFENIVGTFVNLLPLRIVLNDEESFQLMLQNVKSCVLEASENQDFQFDQMLAFLTESQIENKKELVRLHFSFANLLDQYYEASGFEIIQLETKKSERVEFELMLEAREWTDHMTLEFIYNRSLYDYETIALFKDYYYNIMIHFLDNYLSPIKSAIKNHLYA